MTKPRAKGPACPICKQPTVAAYKPFCSTRCADVDLGRWFSGRYVVPGEDGEAAGELEKPAPEETEED